MSLATPFGEDMMVRVSRGLLDLLKWSDNPLQADVHNPRMVDFINEKVLSRGFEDIAYAYFPRPASVC